MNDEFEAVDTGGTLYIRFTYGTAGTAKSYTSGYTSVRTQGAFRFGDWYAQQVLPKPADPGELDRLRRKIAKAIHPDVQLEPLHPLASLTRQERHLLMVEINTAHDRNDVEALRKLAKLMNLRL